MKKYIYYTILFLLLFLPINVLAIVNPTERFYINDYANILSSETEEYIFNKSVALNNVDGTQIVVVTVPNLESYSLERYANVLFNTWGIGNSERDNGLLLLLALEEREFRVEVGDGLGGILPDGKTGRFQDDYIIPHLRNNDWDTGIKNGYDAFYSEIVKLNNLDLEYNNPTTDYTYVNTELDPLLVFSPFLTFIFAFIGMIFGGIIKVQKKAKRNRNTKLYLLIWLALFIITTFLLIGLLMPLVTNIIIFIIARFSSGSGGSSRSYGGYRSSSSSSSSRSFSGGGGRSSGGGSSRRF